MTSLSVHTPAKASSPKPSLATRVSRWARAGGVQTTVEFSGRFRTVVDLCAIAIGWMSKGGAYDNRTLRERMRAGNWYWRAAGRALVQKKAGR